MTHSLKITTKEGHRILSALRRQRTHIAQYGLFEESELIPKILALVGDDPFIIARKRQVSKRETTDALS
jgi:hypothetical protein